MKIVINKNADVTLFHKEALQELILEADNAEEMQKLVELVKENFDLSIHV